MTPRTKAERQEALTWIERAQHALLNALHAASPLKGWADGPDSPYQSISRHYDDTKVLWHRVAGYPMPTGHDADDTRTVSPLDLKPRTAREG